MGCPANSPRKRKRTPDLRGKGVNAPAAPATVTGELVSIMPLAVVRLGRRKPALIREPGDLPMTVVPQPGGVYRV